MERIKVTLDEAEFSALVQLSERELRPVSEQVRAIVRQRLRRTGLLAAERRRAEVAHAGAR